MAERAFVEKPFLEELASLDWQVVDQGPGVPTDPTTSLRTSFREVILEGVFRAKPECYQPHRGGSALANGQAPNSYNLSDYTIFAQSRRGASWPIISHLGQRCFPVTILYECVGFRVVPRSRTTRKVPYPQGNQHA